MSEKELTLVPRPVRDSQSEMAEIVLPNDANPLNALLGGRLMHWMDLAGALAALLLFSVWLVAPQCPECGSVLSVRDTMDPGLRHCRRCLSIYRTESRR